MTTNTVRPIQTPNPGIGGLLRLIGAIVLIALIAGWLLSSWRAGKVITVNEPLPTAQPAQDPAVAYTIPTGNSDLPELTFTVESVNQGYNLTDSDGDVFFCEAMPASLASMEQCSFVETRMGGR